MIISSVLNILQLICQRSCAFMNDIIGVMRERRVSVALLQELCVSKERGVDCQVLGGQTSVGMCLSRPRSWSVKRVW